MKAKSFDLKKASNVKSRHNKTFDFVGLYKSTADTNKTTTEKCLPKDISDVPKSENLRTKDESLNCQRTPNKNKKKSNESVSISQIDIDGSTLNSSFDGSIPLKSSKMTSTPNCSSKTSAQVSKVKSIMKNTSASDEYAEGPETVIKYNSKKRNKSVSFMLDDNEEIAVKKIKPAEPKNVSEQSKFFKTIRLKREKVHHSEKENKVDINQNIKQLSKSKAKISKKKYITDTTMETDGDLENNTEKSERKKMNKNGKKVTTHEGKHENVIVPDSELCVGQSVETKMKKKKHQIKSQTDEEPATKARKTDIKPDVIAEDLELLKIGDNAHTLSNLLDEMVVVDKNKRKKSKPKLKSTTLPTPTTELPTVTESEKEKLKWNKRKWNKDKKGDIDIEILNTSVIVENIPISIVLTYRTVLWKHFEKYGLIKKIGIAEVYPTEESKPVFTTTIYFYNDAAATQALEENNSLIEGSRIRIKRPLPATETTVVLRTYAELNEQNVTSLFTGTGKIRNIRHLVKGKKALSTAFVEFDGPESVERAMKKCKDSKIGNKKVHIAKFEVRTSKKKSKTDEANIVDRSNSDV